MITLAAAEERLSLAEYEGMQHMHQRDDANSRSASSIA